MSKNKPMLDCEIKKNQGPPIVGLVLYFPVHTLYNANSRYFLMSAATDAVLETKTGQGHIVYNILLIEKNMKIITT